MMSNNGAGLGFDVDLGYAPIASSNIGFRLLQKHGWIEGTGLGVSEQTDKYRKMEGKDAEVGRKRMRQSVEDKQLLVVDAKAAVGEDAEATVGEETETEVPLSEQMQLDIARIHEKINSFTTLVSELMGSGKSLLLEISNQFVERLISIHKEQTEKWLEDIRELRLLVSIKCKDEFSKPTRISRMVTI